ncbi:MAG: hypothetical protein AB7T22_14465 [Calditrichaceae bacterium]
MSNSEFEWYYFDIHTQNGYDIVFTLHTKPFNTVFPVALFDLFIYKNNKSYAHKFFSKPVHMLRKNYDNYAVYYDQNNFIRNDGERIIVSAQDENMVLKIELNDPSLNRRGKEIELMPGGGNDTHFKWILYTPMCRAKAEFCCDDQQHFFEGRGYHDYNAGNFRMKDMLRQWYWGKFYLGDTTLIYGAIIGKNGEKRSICIQSDGREYHQDDQPEKSVGGGRIVIRCNQKEFVFTVDKSFMLENYPFYMFNLSAHFKWVGKIIEMIIYFISKKTVLKKFTFLLANVRYHRYRKYLKYNNAPVDLFFEEIRF